MIFRFITILAVCIQGFACSVTQPQSSMLKGTSAPFPVQPEALTPDTFWTYFVGTWQDPTYRGYIKFSMTVDEQGTLSSLIWHPSTFAYHADHLRILPAYAGFSTQQLDTLSLYREGRRLLLGTVLVPNSVIDSNHPDVADVQLIGQDPLQPELVNAVFNVLQENMPVVPRQLFYFPVAEQLAYVAQDMNRFQSSGINIAQRSTHQERICYSSGWGVGHVRVVKQGELEGLLTAGAITSDDILVMDEVPRELPVVAGIVVSQTSSPSSHPALLAGMLGIPFVYEKNATQLANWQLLAQSGNPVFFQASGDTVGACQFLIRDGRSLTQEEAARLKALKKPQPLLVGDYDHTAKEPLLLDQLGRTDANKVGAKAANVAELRRIIPKFTVSEGLALPIGLFAEAIESAKTSDGKSLRAVLDGELAQLLNPGISSQETAEALARVRLMIEKAKLSQAMQEKILKAIQEVFPVGTRIKLRSSSNIEDHPEFNGAGLYESKGACVGDDDNQTHTGLCQNKKDSVIKSVQKVWASLYNFKAWVARRYYGVNEQYSGMGILVQRSYKGELANGVAISAYPAFHNNGQEPQTIEVQSTGFPGEDLEVANPPAGKIPETSRITKDGTELQIASSEVPRGRMLMADHLYRQLYEQMAIVHEHYLRAVQPLDPSQFKLDMEWKLVETQGLQHIIIKQVRPVPMSISSTQGLDRGLFLIGERQAKLCPSPREHRKALSKLDLSLPLELSMRLQEIPGDQRTTVANPLESLSVAGQRLKLSPTATVEYTDWEELWGTRNEFRSYTVSAPVILPNGSYQLQWSGRQERALAHPRLLFNNVQSIWAAEFRLRQDADHAQEYQVVVGDHACESDAYQGFQPGSFQASIPYAQERTPPTPYIESYAAQDDSGYELTIRGRSSMQGFDKTRFVHIDASSIRGLLPRELLITSPFKAVYAPGHHNFSFEYAFDVLAAAELTQQEKDSLIRRGMHRLVLRTVSPFAGFWSNLFTEAETATELSNDGPTFELVAVDAQGQERILSTVVQTEKSQAAAHDSGMGIGILR